MNTEKKLSQLLEEGSHQIGEVFIIKKPQSIYLLCHWKDREKIEKENFEGIEVYNKPIHAEKLSRLDKNGEFRYLKGERTLKKGWLLTLTDITELRAALDYIYPAAIGLYFAYKDKMLRTQNLRDKLSRQTGMYKHSSKISNSGAQNLIMKTCGDKGICAKNILWQIDETCQTQNISTPPKIIPLLCQEACNHLVAQCRVVAKEEFESKED